MITVIATGDRESDLYYWAGITTKNPLLRAVPSSDCATDSGYQRFLLQLQTISLLAEDRPLVVHNLNLTEDIVPLLSSYKQDIYVISPAGKLPKLGSKATVISDKITDTTIKTSITSLLKKFQLEISKDDLIRIYLLLSTEDGMGKERLSPLKFLTFERQLRAIGEDGKENAQTLLQNLIGVHEGKASQWELLYHLFSSHKKTQKEYFAALGELMSPYEIMSLAKSTILLVMAILIGREERLDGTTIASKLGKHPFYISSLMRTVQTQNITYPRAFKMSTRLMNLETALKSGKFDDEQFGFEVLLATI